jgi:hypothetical protein
VLSLLPQNKMAGRFLAQTQRSRGSSLAFGRRNNNNNALTQLLHHKER